MIIKISKTQKKKNFTTSLDSTSLFQKEKKENWCWKDKYCGPSLLPFDNIFLLKERKKINDQFPGLSIKESKTCDNCNEHFRAGTLLTNIQIYIIYG